MKRKLKKRKGSVLAFTIILFAVLIILGTFTVSFMLTENNQSLHYSNKTQAYHYARSGAEIVQKALIDKLISFSNDVSQQKDFVDRFDVATKIDIDLDYFTQPIVVENEIINGKKILTVSSTVTYRNVTETVKKGIYSTSSTISSQGFLPGSDELFIYLGDEIPQEKSKNGKSRSIPDEYISKVPDREKGNYKAYNMTVNLDEYHDNFESLKFDNTKKEYYFDPLVNTINGDIQGMYIIDGDLRITDGIVFNGDFNIYVNGKLDIKGTVKFNGENHIFVKEGVYFGENADLRGSKSNAINQLRLYTLNTSTKTNSMTNFNFGTTSNSGKFRVQADLYVNSGNINLGFPKDSVIDGHLIYNGNQNINIKTNSNSYNDRLITGHIYGPFAMINLGIDSYKIATTMGGQVIGNSINVYPNNQNQGSKFYENSTKDRIENNPIPIDISEGIDTNTIRYESFFID